MAKDYTDLTVWAERREDQGAWVFGVTLDGADIVLFGRKLGGVDGDIAAAKALAADTAEQSPALQVAPPVADAPVSPPVPDAAPSPQDEPTTPA